MCPYQKPNFCKRNRCHRSISSLCSFFIVWKSSVLKSLTRMLTLSFMKFFLILDYFFASIFIVIGEWHLSLTALRFQYLVLWTETYWNVGISYYDDIFVIIHVSGNIILFFLYNTKLIRFICRMFFFHDIKSSRIYQEIVMVTDNMKRPVFWYCTRMDLNQWSYIVSGLSEDHWPFLFHVESLNVRVTYWFIITIIKKTYFYSFKRFDTTYK